MSFQKTSAASCRKGNVNTELAIIVSKSGMKLCTPIRHEYCFQPVFINVKIHFHITLW